MSESHLSVTFIAAGIVRSCQSALVRAMFIRARIVRALVRDLVRDHVRAALVRATHVKATLVRATLVRANLLSHIIYSVIHKMKDLLDLRFNRGGSEWEVGSTKSPSEPNRAGIVRSCQIALVRAMFIRAGIVRDHVRDHVKAARVRATLVRATFLRAAIVRDYVRAHFYSRDYLGLCQSHITQTKIVRDHIRAALATVVRWWIPVSCCSTNLMSKISIVSGRSHTADTQVNPSYLRYVHIAISWWICVDCPLLPRPTWFLIHTVTCDRVLKLTFEIASLVWRELLWESKKSRALCIYLVKWILHQKSGIYLD